MGRYYGNPAPVTLQMLHDLNMQCVLSPCGPHNIVCFYKFQCIVSNFRGYDISTCITIEYGEYGDFEDPDCFHRHRMKWNLTPCWYSSAGRAGWIKRWQNEKFFPFSRNVLIDQMIILAGSVEAWTRYYLIRDSTNSIPRELIASPILSEEHLLPVGDRNDF